MLTKKFIIIKKPFKYKIDFDIINIFIITKWMNITN